MARPRGQSFGDTLKTPHSVSLKVLRLTRPSLTLTHALPTTHPKSEASPPPFPIAQAASLAYPSADAKNPFVLTPVLALPESFQSAYVGEVFACTLCANNELPASAGGDGGGGRLLAAQPTRSRVDALRVQAEIQSPSFPAGVPLELEGGDDDAGGTEEAQRAIAPGESRQRIIRLNLKEEGNHVLAVTVTYTETTLGEAGAQAGRVRTFRKLYQFVAQNLVGVRTKAGDLPPLKTAGGSRRRFAVEAQLENLGERGVSLEAVSMAPRPPFRSISLNWETFGTGVDPAHAPILNPRDVVQVAFLLEEQPPESANAEPPDDDVRAPEAKIILGQLNIQWRGAMGDRGSLSTGWLVARQR